MPRAVAFHQEGKLDEAARLYREILCELPQDFDATHLLGVVALQQGEIDAARRLFHTALGINPHEASAMANLGTSYLRDGQPELALHWFELALGLQPDSSVAMTNVGTALHNMGRHRDAIPVLRAARRADSNSYAACSLLGTCLVEIGEPKEAAECFEAATRAEPDNAEGWANLSAALNTIGEPERARESAVQALALHPRSSIALGALGQALIDEGRVAEGIECYRQGVSADPSVNMLAAYGSALLSAGLNDEAIEQFERAVHLDGRNLKIRWAMAIARLKPICATESEILDSRAAFANALTEVEAWYRRTAEVDEPFGAVGAVQPFFLAYQHFNNRELLSRYGALCASWMATLPTDVADAGEAPGACSARRAKVARSKLRVGIASAHVYQHSVWNAITKGWVYNIDRSQFELYLFQLDSTSDRETDRARVAVAHFEDRPKNLSEWVRTIRDQELDVLIYPEIGMHALTLQLACLRLAPVQATTWGVPETTGLPTMDLYFSADGFEPKNASENYCEELIRLPNLGVYVEPLAPAISKPGLGSLNLPRDEPLLLCAGTPFKYSPRFDQVWVEIARHSKKTIFRRSSGGRLVFFRSPSDMMDRMFESRLRAAFAKSDVAFDEHVCIIPKLDRSRFFGLMRHSALMLDTPGFSGFNTAIQAIECGLPVLAFEGEFMRGRLASGIMRRLDMPELVATTAEDFVQKALELSGDAGRRKKIRAKIIARRSVLFHDTEAVRALERGLTDAVAKARARSL
jgi:predicted O-linked N-acetylglucosamine transferase (SPINDLY family)